jgi:hypothetical protein
MKNSFMIASAISSQRPGSGRLHSRLGRFPRRSPRAGRTGIGVVLALITATSLLRSCRGVSDGPR